MKSAQRILTLLSLLLLLETGFAAPGTLFTVTSTGTPAKVNITLCLNGKGPLSCQIYTTEALNISILSNIPNHNYPTAGIKINTPGYTIKNAGIDCIPNPNGYCLFSVSNALAKQLSLQKKQQSIPAITGGTYSDGTYYFPLLATSNNDGTNWSYKIEKNMNLPRDYISSGIVNSTDCSGIHCVAVGIYFDGSLFYPFLAASSNGGINWTYKIEKNLNLPTGFYFIRDFYGVSCSGNYCIAGGGYRANDLIDYPFLAISNDGGTTWTYKIEQNSNLPVSYGVGGRFYAVSCDGSYCIAGGRYQDNTSTYYPMLAVSNDNGATWSYKIQKGLNLPVDYSNNGEFDSVTCSQTNCVAGGTYEDGNSISYPLLTASNDGGITWSYKIQKGLNLPVDYYLNGVINSVSCNGAHCVSGGSYNDPTISYPILAVSSNGGINWNYKIEKATNLPTDFSNNGVFKSVNCGETTCVGGGQYAVGTTFYPLLSVSNDKGATWSYKIEKNKNLPLDEGLGALFYSVECSEHYCTAGGTYLDPALGDYPLLAVSMDMGATWTYKIQKATNLPTDYMYGGSLYSVGVSNNTSQLCRKY